MGLFNLNYTLKYKQKLRKLIDMFILYYIGLATNDDLKRIGAFW